MAVEFNYGNFIEAESEGFNQRKEVRRVLEQNRDQWLPKKARISIRRVPLRTVTPSAEVSLRPIREEGQSWLDEIQRRENNLNSITPKHFTKEQRDDHLEIRGVLAIKLIALGFDMDTLIRRARYSLVSDRFIEQNPPEPL